MFTIMFILIQFLNSEKPTYITVDDYEFDPIDKTSTYMGEKDVPVYSSTMKQIIYEIFINFYVINIFLALILEGSIDKISHIRKRDVSESTREIVKEYVAVGILSTPIVVVNLIIIITVFH
jgi:hypothetical protein